MPENEKSPPNIPSPLEEGKGDPGIRSTVHDLLGPIRDKHTNLSDRVSKLEGTVSHLATHKYVIIAIGSAIGLVSAIVSAVASIK